MARHGENWWSAPLGLDRHDRGRTALQRLRLPQEGHDLLLLAGQRLPQPCVERTDWSTAFELCVLDQQPDFPGTKRREKRGSIRHRSNSSRAPEEDLEANRWFVSTSMSIASESSAIVGRSNKVASPTAVIDCPPRSKKSSRTPIPSTPSSSLQIAATAFSVSVWGGPPSPALALDGAGRAFRSTFPFGVSGRESRNTNCAGTIYSGSLVFRNARSSSVSGTSPLRETTYPTSSLFPGSSSRARTVHACTFGSAARVASISPSSMR